MTGDAPQARRWLLTGRVQGVGFRPFVYRLAHRHGLAGWVQNRLGQVEVWAQGPAAALDAFARDLIDQAPPLARPQVAAATPEPPAPLAGFEIRGSTAADAPEIHVPPDHFTCARCLAELADPHDRRHRYPFINCTQCGPRYTLIAALPYDRPNTSMAGFPLCPDCAAEYRAPMDRRFHAEPIACPACGPRLRFARPGGAAQHAERALAECVGALRAGEVVAVKGVGGYHLLCDAANPAAVQRLRSRKPRPHKPLAVMFPWRGEDGLDALRQAAFPEPAEAELLCGPVRPIVLVRRRAGSPLAPEIAPGLAEVGAMLPYSPLHHLLLEDFGGPLVATSGNLSGEPVLTDPAEVEARLGRVAGSCLHHDRPILRPADVPVYRVIGGRGRPLRLGRGNAPLELTLPVALEQPLLAVGAHMKNTVALAWARRAVVSPHIGDMGTPRSLAVLEQVAGDLQRLYGVQARTVACDAHPGYTTARWARASGLPILPVQHHQAHASALIGEHGAAGTWLVFAWDGVGYGEDGTLWGGEALLGRPGQWRRVGSLRRFRLPGAERAGREPWRSAAALCWELGLDWGPAGCEALREAWRRGMNAPPTSAAGRLFDAAAALTGLLQVASFEGQGPMYLEAACAGPGTPLELPLARADPGLWITDWAPLVPRLLDDALPVAERAADLHATLALAILRQALCVCAEHPVAGVGLTGGVFQNRVLTETAARLLGEHGLPVLLPEQVPANDAGIAFGQAVEVAARLAAQGP
jgi:hydrogenase maturation protein HypF